MGRKGKKRKEEIGRWKEREIVETRRGRMEDRRIGEERKER